MQTLPLYCSFIFLAAGLLFMGSRRRKLMQVSWPELVAQLCPVPTDGIATVALDYLNPRKDQLQIETDEIWNLVGGLEGISNMAENADVLIALAGYAAQWNRVESIIVAERMRSDALALRAATFRIKIGLLFGIGKVRGPFRIQEAASAYYLMRQRLLALYETSHAGRYPVLAAAL